MARQRKKKVNIELKSVQTSAVAANKAPARKFHTFEAFWFANVKNAKNIHLESCRAHLASLGTLEKPDKWAESIRHFGIPVEE